jgi:hypothetical protein
MKQTETKAKQGKKKPNLQHLNTSLSLTTTSISEAEYATNFGSVQWEEMQMGMDQATQNSQKQLKKPDLYEEEKIQRKIETKQRRPYGGWVVGGGGGGDLARLVAGGGGPAGLVVAERSMGRWSRRS